MFGGAAYKAKPLPDGITFYNSFDRKDDVQKKVVLRIKEDKSKMKLRMCLSEHPFGTVKWHHGAYYLLCKGKEKVTGELGLSFLAYNLKRAINIVGVEALIAAM